MTDKVGRTDEDTPVRTDTHKTRDLPARDARPPPLCLQCRTEGPEFQTLVWAHLFTSHQFPSDKNTAHASITSVTTKNPNGKISRKFSNEWDGHCRKKTMLLPVSQGTLIV
ncbi:hypothetical protein BaRGS_00024903 [Batillaria attramentaria]|uniref:Uncharacterized protein n=1 Tax=Batillaria attramentaria TaxID=370345 RepID=A0ABD0K9U2_9CAEN